MWLVGHRLNGAIYTFVSLKILATQNTVAISGECTRRRRRRRRCLAEVPLAEWRAAAAHALAHTLPPSMLLLLLLLQATAVVHWLSREMSPSYYCAAHIFAQKSQVLCMAKLESVRQRARLRQERKIYIHILTYILCIHIFTTYHISFIHEHLKLLYQEHIFVVHSRISISHIKLK